MIVRININWTLVVIVMVVIECTWVMQYVGHAVRGSWSTWLTEYVGHGVRGSYCLSTS